MRTQSLVSFVTLALFASSSLANPVPVSGPNGYKVLLKVGRDATEGMQYDRLQYRQAPASASPDAAGTAHSEVTFVKGALQGATAGGANPVVGLMGNVRRSDGAGVGPSGVAVNKLLLNSGNSPNLGYVKRVSNPATQTVTAQESALKGVNSENVVQNSGYQTPDTTSFESGTASAHIPVRVGLKDAQDGGNSKSNGAGSTDHASLSLSSSKSSGLGDSIVANNPTGMRSDMETLSGSAAPLSDPLQAADTAIDSKNIAHRSNSGFVLSGNPIVALVGSPGATDDNVRGAIDRVTSAGLDINKALEVGPLTSLLNTLGSGSKSSGLASLSPSGSAGGKSGDLNLPRLNAFLDSHAAALSGSIVTPSSDTKTSGSASSSGDTTIGGPIGVGSPKTSTPNIPIGTPAQPDGQLDDASNRNISDAGVGVGNVPAQTIGANGIPALGSSGAASTSPNLGGAIPNVQSGSVPNLPVPNDAANALTNAPGSIPSLGSPGQGGSTSSIPGIVSIPSGSISSLQGSQGNSGSSPSLPGLGGISTPPPGPNPLFSPPVNGGSTPGLGLSGPQGSIPNVDNLPRPIPNLDTNAGTSVGKDQKSVETSLVTGKPDLSTFFPHVSSSFILTTPASNQALHPTAPNIPLTHQSSLRLTLWLVPTQFTLVLDQ
ncbi:hypothetical protein BJ165DRAFT_299783 [Panaeolus papilionaceus]|nr:hypothetical protein BJ165DRAFT_299783 [Panaeolus papilionaceus]